MPTLNDLQLSSWETLTGNTGQLNDLLVEYLQAIAGITSNNPNDLWYKVLTDLGYTGAVQDMQLEYWADITGTTGAWNDLYYQWLLDTGGAFGLNVNIQRNNDPGFCDFEEPATANCEADETYTANDSGFTNPADTWLWTIEPPVVGVNLTKPTLKTCTVTTTASDVDVTFNLKVVATDSVSTDTANRTTTFTQNHNDLTEVPVFIGPDIVITGLVQGVAITPFDVSPRFTGYIESWSLEGTWPAGLVISGVGVLTGTPTDPVADYPGLTFRATNYVGSADSNIFTVAIIAGEVAPVFSGTVPDFAWEIDVPITPVSLSAYFTGSVATYTLTGGTLPLGISLGIDGVLSGTPNTEETQAGIIVTATNGAGSDATNAFQQLIWMPIEFTTIPADTMTVGVFYSKDYAQYFTGTISTYGFNTGDWPPGLSINPATGLVTGTPLTEATYLGPRVSANSDYEPSVLSNSFTLDVEAAATGPVFYALTPDPVTYEMLGVRTGTGGLITTHTADLYAPDVDGVYQKFPANAPVWTGGRAVLSGAAGTDVVSYWADDPIGTPLAEVPCLQYYPGATNSVLQSNDLTNAAWFPTTMTAARTEVGITGVPNSATLLTATAGNALMISTAITAVSATQATVWWLKRSVGTGVIEITVDNAATWQPIILTTDYQKFTLDQAAVANPVIGIRIVTSGDAVIVGQAECHTDSTIDEVKDFGPIFTTTAAATAGQVRYEWDFANSDLHNAAWYAEYDPQTHTEGAAIVVGASTGAGVGILFQPDDARLSTYDGAQLNLSNIFITDDIMYKIAAVYSVGDDINLNADGVWGTQRAFNDAIISSSRLNFAWIGAFATAPVKLRELQRYNITTFAEGEIIIDGLMV